MDELKLAALGVRRIVTDTRLDEVVLPEQSRQRLDWVVDWVVQSPQALSEWGLRHYLDGGFRALFRGPSGTGKTMAAAAIARHVGRQLFHVDLASASEYADETESMLRELFAIAEEEGAILLFDEADALFDGAAEVDDAGDRYANAEVAYLLRKIETFEGLAILTTNSSGKIDDAFGRIDVVVDFPMPDEAAREQLWRDLLGVLKPPPAADVDAASLAKEHEFSGAEILKCVRLAAVLAAAASTAVDMKLIKLAAAERLAMR